MVVVVVDVELGGSEVLLVAKMRLSGSNLGAWHYRKLESLIPATNSKTKHKMPGIVNGLEPGKKRKRKDGEPGILKKSRRAPKAQEADLQEDILGLEQKILESRTNYNSIHTLLDYIRVEVSADEKDVLAAVALCRVFCRLMAAGNLNKPQDKASNEATIVQWLKGKLQEYEHELLKLLKNEVIGRQSTALTLLMRLFKEEATHLDKPDEAIWRDGLFERLLRTVVEDDVGEDTRTEFMEKYVEEYDDVRYYTFARLAYVWALFEMNQ